MARKCVALAAILAAAATFSSTADAAGGVRLGFGGPLGTFTATPSKGTASGSAHASRVKQAARKPRASAPAREAVKRPDKTAPRMAHAERTPRKGVGTADAPGQRVARLTGSSALIQSALPDTEPDETRAEASVEATADAPAERAATADTEETEGGSAKEAGRGATTCSKFIPAVGMTVTVECDD